jgi:hypothetical protein
LVRVFVLACGGVLVKKFLKKLEKVVDDSIPGALAILLIVILIEVFFHAEAEPYRFYIDVVDWAVVVLFIIDLCFKYNEVRQVAKFVEAYWLDILAVFPFYFAFRVLERVLLLARAERYLLLLQDVVHGGLESSRIAARGERFARLLRPLLRLPRFLKAGSRLKRQ